MAGVTVKMGVDVSQFRQGMQQAQQSAKTVQAQMKANEAQYKATGDKEQYMAEKAKLMQKQLDEQRKIAQNAEKALEAMRKNGVEETSAAYQKMEQQLAGAQAAMYSTEAAMNTLTTSEQKAATGANDLTSSLNSINKKVSLDAVIGGINTITGALEKAGKLAVQVGQGIWDSIMDSAAYADDIGTMAERMGLTPGQVQRMRYVAAEFEAPVEMVAKAWKKTKMSMTSDSDEIAAAYESLGVATHEMKPGKIGAVATEMRDYVDVFWETGEAIMAMNDAAEQERMAQLLLGRSWEEMSTMFLKGRAAYEEAMEGATVNSEDAVNNAAELNDKIAQLEESFKVLKLEVVGAIAPALTQAATVLEKLIKSITEYLKTDEGQEMLQKLGDAVSRLFEDLASIDPEKVVSNFVSVFEKLVGAFEWISNNWEGVKAALIGVLGVFGLAKITSGATSILNATNALRNFGGGGKTTGGGSGNGGTGSTPKTSTPKASAPKTGPVNYGDLFADSTFRTVAGTGATAAGSGAAHAMVPGLSGIGTGGGMMTGGLTAAGILGGSAISAAMFYGIAKLATSGNYTINIASDPHGYDKLEDRESMQTAVRGILSAGRSGRKKESSVGWAMRYLMYHIDSPEDFFNLFNYTDAERGEQNWIVDMMGKSDRNSSQGALYAMWRARFGDDNTLLNGLTPEQRAAILEGKSMWQSGNSSYVDLYPYMWDFLNSHGMRDENGQWWIPSLYEEEQKKQAEADEKVAQAASDMAEAALAMEELPEQMATAVSQAIGNTKVTFSTGGFGDYITRLIAGYGEGHANGLWSVPWDGYPAILHKGERVLTAGEAQRYTYNNYFGNVNLNNGLEIDALTESIERRNRRQRAGFGAA